jgi:hypothetical protein
VVSAAKSAAQPIPASIKAPTQAPAAKSSIASAAQQAVSPAIRAAADKIKQEYLAKTYPMLSAADKAALQSTEPGRSLAKLGESPQISEQFFEEAALVAAQGPQPRLGSGKNILTKVRIMHSSCTKLEFSSKNLYKPKIVGGHTNHDLFLKIDEAFKFNVLAERNGCRLVLIQIGDQDPFPKTLPPKDWGPQMLYDKIIEAVDNASFFETVDKGKQVIVETVDQLIISPARNRRWTAIGKTSEGIEMKMAIDYKNGMIDIASGYIHDLWILGLRP